MTYTVKKLLLGGWALSPPSLLTYMSPATAIQARRRRRKRCSITAIQAECFSKIFRFTPTTALSTRYPRICRSETFRRIQRNELSEG